MADEVYGVKRNKSLKDISAFAGAAAYPVYAKDITLLYNTAYEMQSWVQDVPSDIFSNKSDYFISIALEAASGTPYDNVEKLYYEVRQGQFVVTAKGSGFVSGHALSVSLMIFKKA